MEERVRSDAAATGNGTRMMFLIIFMKEFIKSFGCSQVAGHGSWDKSQAILTNKDGYILKPIQAIAHTLIHILRYSAIYSSK